MKKITFTIAVLIAAMSFGQNLATNGDFEDHNPFDPTLHAQPTDDASNLSVNYINDDYHKRNKASKKGMLEETNASYVQGTRGAKIPTTNTHHIRYGIKPLLTVGITYNLKYDILGTGDLSLYNKAINVKYYQDGNQSLGQIGENFKPTTLDWYTWGGQFTHGDLTQFPLYDNTLDQYIHISLNATSTPDTYIDNLKITIVGCNNEVIEIPSGTTSFMSIYENDVNNGAAIDLGVNTNLTSYNFYEADGTTDANAKFTLNADGTITSTGGSEGSNYKIEYILTSTGDADASGTNDHDTLVQTFSVTAAYLPEKLDFPFDSTDEGWVPNEFGTSSVVAGELNIELIDPVGNEAEKIYVNQTTNSVSTAGISFVQFRYKNNTMNDTFRFQFTNAANQNANIALPMIPAVDLVTENSYVVETIDLSAFPEWTATPNAKNFQFMIKDEAYELAQGMGADITTPGTFVLDRVLFSSNGSLSVDDVDYRDDANIVLYPNPVSSILRINAPNRIEKIEVFNLLGQRVLFVNDDKVDVSRLNKGIYISKIYQEGDIISTKRFIKQ